MQIRDCWYIRYNTVLSNVGRTVALKRWIAFFACPQTVELRKDLEEFYGYTLSICPDMEGSHGACSKRSAAMQYHAVWAHMLKTVASLDNIAVY